MTTTDTPAAPSTPSDATGGAIPAAAGLVLPRRSFLRGAAVAAGGAVAVAAAACAPAAGSAWSVVPLHTSSHTGSGGNEPPAQQAADATPAPSGLMTHDDEAKAVVARFLGGEAAALEGLGNQPLEPTLDGDTKVYDLTIDRISHKLTATMDPIPALGYNGTWPGPRLQVVEGDRVRATFTNNLGDETTGVHFHGQALPNAMDGVPFVTQAPIQPGGQFTYEFVAGPSGSHMYHSHHNATDQVGRGLLGAFIVDPSNPSERYGAKYGATQDIVWISNDAYGGFTINGRQFPATAPITAALGETIVIRFMNEGVMMHPWHLHGMRMKVVARDGYPLGTAGFECDTLGVNPGERWDVVIECRNPGAWAFHCHILPHAEGSRGMYGMVTALVVLRTAPQPRRRMMAPLPARVVPPPVERGEAARPSAAPPVDALDTRFATILLATDLSPASADATTHAIDLAARLGARLLIVHVMDSHRLAGGGAHDRVDQARAEREAALVEVVRRARSRGVAAEFLVWTGDPGSGVAAAAEAEGADLVVVGTRGRRGAGRMLLGSVSDHLVRQARCPVLVVRPGTGASA